MARGRIAAVGALVCVCATLVSACSWRVESEPEPIRTPTALTVTRDHVAAAEAALAAAAASEPGEVAAAEAAAIPVRLQALGGLSPTSSPRPATDFVVMQTRALDQARECMTTAGDDPLGGLCSSIALSHAAIGARPSSSAWESLAFAPAPPLTPGVSTDVPSGTLAKLALDHDRLRALYEVVAARSAGAERTAALSRSAAERERVAELLALPGVENLTEPAYDIPAASVVDTATRNQTSLAAELSLAETYAALVVAAGPQDREWLYNAALTGYRAASELGLAASDIPALPGAVQPSPSPTN